MFWNSVRINLSRVIPTGWSIKIKLNRINSPSLKRPFISFSTRNSFILKHVSFTFHPFVLFLYHVYNRYDRLWFMLGGLSFKKKDVKFAIRKGVRCSAQPSVPPAWPGTALVDPGTKNWDGQKPISIVGSTGSIGTQVNMFITLYILYICR